MAENIVRRCFGNSNEDVNDIKPALDSSISVILIAEGDFYYPKVKTPKCEILPCPYTAGSRSDRCRADSKSKLGYCYHVRAR